jgi:hypothetical protein
MGGAHNAHVVDGDVAKELIKLHILLGVGIIPTTPFILDLIVTAL